MDSRPLWDGILRVEAPSLDSKSFREKSLSKRGFLSVGPSLLHGTPMRLE